MFLEPAFFYRKNQKIDGYKKFENVVNIAQYSTFKTHCIPLLVYLPTRKKRNFIPYGQCLYCLAQRPNISR